MDQQHFLVMNLILLRIFLRCKSGAVLPLSAFDWIRDMISPVETKAARRFSRLRNSGSPTFEQTLRNDKTGRTGPH